jgi:trehalose 6-phosphate phosphatase
VNEDLRRRIEAAAAQENVILASDFDGCLAAFTEEPMDARPQPGTIESLREAAGLPGVTVALVSGRELSVLRDLSGVEPQEPIILIGSHGGESSAADDAGGGAQNLLTDEQRALLAETDAALVAIAEQYDGAWVERKVAGVVLHTRTMADQEAGERALAQAREYGLAHPELHVMSGKCVVEFPMLRATKGTALHLLAAATGATVTVYLGDDVTDERAFEVLEPDRGDVSIKVGSGQTAAVCRLDRLEHVPGVLAAFVAARRARRP